MFFPQALFGSHSLIMALFEKMLYKTISLTDMYNIIYLKTGLELGLKNYLFLKLDHLLSISKFISLKVIMWQNKTNFIKNALFSLSSIEVSSRLFCYWRALCYGDLLGFGDLWGYQVYISGKEGHLGHYDCVQINRKVNTK